MKKQVAFFIIIIFSLKAELLGVNLTQKLLNFEQQVQEDVAIDFENDEYYDLLDSLDKLQDEIDYLNDSMDKLRYDILSLNPQKNKEEVDLVEFLSFKERALEDLLKKKDRMQVRLNKLAVFYKSR